MATDPKQLGLPTLEEAKKMRDAKIQQATANADPEWQERAWDRILILAHTGPHFTSDDVWDRLDKPREPRALAGVLRKAQARGFIEKGNVWTPSRYRHAAPVMVWRSKVYGAG